MVRAFVVLLVVASPVLAETREEYNLRRTLEGLQGNWGVKNLFVAGRSMPARESYTFRDDVFVKNSEPEEAARINVDLSSPVPKVEFIDRHGVTMLGIMQRTPNGIVMCLVEAGTAPPKTFTSTPENGAVLIELERSRRP